MWVPYSVFVTARVPAQIGYKENETLVREWDIFNNSTQEIRGLQLSSVAGDTCSKEYAARNYYYNFPEFLLMPKARGVVTLRDKVFQSIPGVYKCEMKMSTAERLSMFGPGLTYELAIINS